MKLPDGIRLSGQKALSALYRDRATVFRKQKKANLLEDAAVCQGLKCHLSFNRVSPIKRQALFHRTTAAVSEGSYTIYLPVDADVRMGDSLLIFHCGQFFRGVAGRPFRSNFCLAVPFEEWEIA
ncbi:MAG TPA: hypothetical protein IAB57_00925 [Candidatus Fimivivens faecavium]|nr:hypothetical protein [Candidatus Fimivivens faecavium]